MKCLKKKQPDGGAQYARVQEGEAHLLVATEGWEYCSKEEYKKMRAGEENHG